MIIMNENVLNIKYYKEIIKLQDFQMEVLMEKNRVKINGKDLTIQYYSEHEVVINGEIESMVFTQ